MAHVGVVKKILHPQLITEQLQREYQLIYTSKQHGFMHLHQRNDFKAFLQ